MLDVLVQPDLDYDYDQIADGETRTLARRAAQDIKPRLRRAAQDIVIIGQRLAEVQAKLPHGQWTPWLETEFDMTYRTAVNFIRVADRFSGKSEMISDLTPTALYALAAPSTPEDAIIEVEQHIAAGNPPTVAQTKQIIANHKPAPKTPIQDERFSFQSRVAAVNLVLNEQPEAAELILDDLRNGRKGWYHELILCYTDDTDADTWRAVARHIDARQPVPPAVSAPPSTVFPSGDNKELSPETPRERRIAQAQSLPPKTYNVILADPPWQYNNTGLNGAAANHYDTMSTRDLGGLLWSLGLNIAENAVLFLWVTNPLLEDAFEIINNWGFRYKTNMVWVKDRIGTGFYVRGMHELLLICTKGAMTPIDTGHTPPITSVITAPTQEHSRKPDQVHDLIEQLYPGCNYIELFARRPRQGWDVWGNEVNQ